MKRFLSFVLLFFSFVLKSQSQFESTVQGFVFDKANGEPIPFCNVFFKNTNLSASTDLNGFFNINRIVPGEYTLLITNFDFDTIIDHLSIKGSSIINKKFFAIKGGVKLDEIEITTEASQKTENTSVGFQKIDPIIINKLPSVGEPDIAQYLQVLPGVVFTGDQGGQLYIRGGLPVQNKVLLDGLIVYNPFHSIGLFSVFDNDIMKNADVYSAGFGAEYGGRTSSIMDITTRDGNKKRHSGKISASTFGAKTTLEGPLLKLNDEGNTSISYLFSAKHSYLPQTSKILYSYANPNGLPFNYTDIYSKVSINSTNGSKFSLFGFNFNDKVDYSDIASFGWKNIGVGTNFLLVPQNSSLLIEGVFAYSNYRIDFKNPTKETDSKYSSINGVNTGFNFVKFIGKQEIRFGFEGITTNTEFQIQNPQYALITLSRATIDLGAFIKYKFIDVKKRLVFEPSFRYQYYATMNVASPEPRASLKVNFTKKIRFKAAAGLYSQSLMSANSDRDVVNLFYGFINAPENQDLSKEYLDINGKSQTVNSSIQKANHIVTGFEFDLWAVYSLTFNDRWFGNTSTGIVSKYAPSFDRRNNINIVASYMFGKKKNWELNARWNFGTGFPFTQTQGFVNQFNPQGNINYNFPTANGTLNYIPAELNGGRFPDFHRLDIGLKYKYRIKENNLLEVNMGATNLYNQKNIFYVDRFTFKIINQLPIMPNVNISFTF